MISAFLLYDVVANQSFSFRLKASATSEQTTTIGPTPDPTLIAVNFTWSRSSLNGTRFYQINYRRIFDNGTEGRDQIVTDIPVAASSYTVYLPKGSYLYAVYAISEEAIEAVDEDRIQVGGP